MKKRGFLHELLFYLVILVAIIFVLSTLFSGGEQKEPIAYDDVLNYFYNGQVTKVVVTPDNELVLTVKEGEAEVVKEYQLKSFELFHADLNPIIQEQVKNGTIEFYEPQPPVKTTVLPSIEKRSFCIRTPPNLL